MVVVGAFETLVRDCWMVVIGATGWTSPSEDGILGAEVGDVEDAGTCKLGFLDVVDFARDLDAADLGI